MGAFLVTYPRDRIRTVLLIGWFVRVTSIPAALLIGLWFLTQLVSFGVYRRRTVGRRGLYGSHRWHHVRGPHRAPIRGSAPARRTAGRRLIMDAERADKFSKRRFLAFGCQLSLRPDDFRCVRLLSGIAS